MKCCLVSCPEQSLILLLLCRGSVGLFSRLSRKSGKFYWLLSVQLWAKQYHYCSSTRKRTWNLLAQLTGAQYTEYISAEVRDSPNDWPGYDPKQTDSEALIMLVLWRTQSISLWSLFPDPLSLRVVTSDRAQSMDQIELNCGLMLNRIVWNRIFWHSNCIHMLKWVV